MLLGCQLFSEVLINGKHKTELDNRMEWDWDHFHRFRHCPLSSFNKLLLFNSFLIGKGGLQNCN